MTVLHRMRLAFIGTFVATILLGLFGLAQAATVTLDLYVRPNAGEEFIYEALKNGFESAYPNIKINLISTPFGEYFQKYSVMYAAGTAPDVFMPSTSWTVSYAMQDMLMPIDDLVLKDKFPITDIFPEVLGMYRVNNKLYALPNGIASMAFLYNADRFAEKGVQPPPLNWTTADFLTIGHKLTSDANGDGRIDQFAVGGLNYNFFIWSALGSNFFDSELYPRKFLLNSPAGYTGLQFVQDLRWKEHLYPQPGEPADIYAGTAAMSMIGHWNLAVVLKQAKFSWDLLSVPRVKDSVQRADGSSWAMSKSTKHPAESWLLLKWLGGYEGNFIQASNQYITPAHKKVAVTPEWRKIPGGPNISKEPFVYGLDHSYNAYVLTHPKGNDVMNLLNPAIAQVWDNKASPQQAMGTVEKAIMDLLPTLK